MKIKISILTALLLTVIALIAASPTVYAATATLSVASSSDGQPNDYDFSTTVTYSDNEQGTETFDSISDMEQTGSGNFVDVKDVFVPGGPSWTFTRTLSGVSTGTIYEDYLTDSGEDFEPGSPPNFQPVIIPWSVDTNTVGIPTMT